MIEFQKYTTDSSYKLEKGQKVELWNGTKGIIEVTDNYSLFIKDVGFFHRTDIRYIEDFKTQLDREIEEMENDLFTGSPFDLPQ